MTRSTVLFATAAICMLVFAFLSRWFGPAGFVDFHLHRRGYGFSPDSVCVFIAALLCAFAAIYSFYLLPMNQKAAMWHFWLTAIGILLFWMAFYSLAARVTGGYPLEKRGVTVAIVASWMSSFALVLIGQGIFVANLVSGIIKLRHRV
jgi:hypothetical protein